MTRPVTSSAKSLECKPSEEVEEAAHILSLPGLHVSKVVVGFNAYEESALSMRGYDELLSALVSQKSLEDLSFADATLDAKWSGFVDVMLNKPQLKRLALSNTSASPAPVARSCDAC